MGFVKKYINKKIKDIRNQMIGDDDTIFKLKY